MASQGVEVQIKIKNLEQIKAALNSYPNEAAKHVNQAIKKTVFHIRGKAVRFAPAVTSFLRGSAYTSFRPMQGEVGFRAHYACVYNPDTQVTTDKGLKRIGSVNVGDMVLTQDGQYHKVLATPKRMTKEKPDLVDLVIQWRKDRNRNVTLTQDHKVLSKVNGAVCWVEAGKLQPNDTVFTRIKVPHNKGAGRSKYVQVNPSMESFIDTSVFRETKVINTNKWTFKPNKGSGGLSYVYDLTVEDVHSFVASGIVISNSFVHEGTKPHIIEPRFAKALYWEGLSHPVKRVHHPGTKANPFLQKAVDVSEPQIEKFFEDAVQRTLDNIGKRTR